MARIGIKESRKILGIDPNADQTEIKSRYISLAKVHHPDKGGDAHEFSRIREAYEVLSTTHITDTQARDIEEMIFDEIWNDWVGEQDGEVQATVRDAIHRMENDEV